VRLQITIADNLDARKCLVNEQGTFTVNFIYLFLISGMPPFYPDSIARR
jgi:hypothetical protein